MDAKSMRRPYAGGFLVVVDCTAVELSAGSRDRKSSLQLRPPAPIMGISDFQAVPLLFQPSRFASRPHHPPS
jgi:hypothetical protein